MSGSNAVMRGGYVQNGFVLPTSTPSVHARADVIAAAAALPPAGKVKLAGGMVFGGRRSYMSGAMGGDAATGIDTSSISGFFSSVVNWVSANPLLAGAGAIGAFMLTRKGRR